MEEAAHRYSLEADIAKGFGILGVIMLHSSALYLSRTSSGVLQLINVAARYAVPLFLIVSGFLDRKISGETDKLRFAAKKTVNRFKRLMVPYFLFSTVYMLIRVGLEAMPITGSLTPARYSDLASAIKAIVLIRENPAGHLYFLPLLFFTMVLFTLIELVIPDKRRLLLICCVMSLTAYLSAGDIYLSLNPLKALGFYSIGSACQMPSFRDWFLTHKHLLSSLIAAMVFIFCYSYSPAQYKKYFYYLIQTAGALFVLQLSFFIASISQAAKINEYSARVGQYSFDIYLLHEPYVLTALFIVLLKTGIMNVWLNQSLLFIAGFAIPLVVSSRWLRKMKTYRHLFLGLS